MPIREITKNGQKFYRWGDHGALYRSRAKAEAQAAAAHANGFTGDAKPKPKLLKPIPPNAGIEAAYAKQITALLDEMTDSVEYWLKAGYRKHEPLMAQDSVSTDMQKIIQALIKRFIKKFDKLAPEAAQKFADKTFKHTDRTMAMHLKAMGWTVPFKVNKPMQDALNATIHENVGLIRSIPQEYLTDIEGAVMRSYAVGHDLKTMTDEIQRIGGVTRRRAAFIAHDQTSKANATATLARSVALGFTKAVWRHSKGGKEPRPSHVAASGTVYEQGKGCLIDGEWILPGTLPNCRCLGIIVAE